VRHCTAFVTKVKPPPKPDKSAFRHWAAPWTCRRTCPVVEIAGLERLVNDPALLGGQLAVVVYLRHAPVSGVQYLTDCAWQLLSGESFRRRKPGQQGETFEETKRPLFGVASITQGQKERTAAGWATASPTAT